MGRLNLVLSIYLSHTGVQMPADPPRAPAQPPLHTQHMDSIRIHPHIHPQAKRLYRTEGISSPTPLPKHTNSHAAHPGARGHMHMDTHGVAETHDGESQAA